MTDSLRGDLPDDGGAGPGAGGLVADPDHDPGRGGRGGARVARPGAGAALPRPAGRRRQRRPVVQRAACARDHGAHRPRLARRQRADWVNHSGKGATWHNSRQTWRSSGPARRACIAAYYAGFRGLRVAVVDSLPELGGQITAMYPEKQILDVAGFPTIKGRDLVEGLVEQANTAEPDYLLDRTAVGLAHTDDDVTVTPRRRQRGAGQGAADHRRDRQVQPASAARRRRLARPRHGVLRAQLRAVRRQGRRHRRRRRLGVRLGDPPRAGRPLDHAGPPPRRVPRPRAHRPGGARLEASRSSPRPR